MESIEAALAWSRAFVERYHIEFIAICAALATLALLLSFATFLHLLRLRKDVRILRMAHQRLMAAEEKRIIREIKENQRT